MSHFPANPLDCLAEIERRVLWLASWTIHNANHLRPAGEVKVADGVQRPGRQASSTSRLRSGGAKPLARV